ncbi:hypothetical protein GCM10020358_18120 [Amorphoplanes nipponensis]|uniref:Uncharacterized protein n=1 Tax=Actinoplanes nipponensis TaxID=135950 RepID=A0A919JKS2_9ACTN|nr:hypothetical protein [Actinoplanes nipponensis]GIE52391.1 hypothetical protein Ani05nite_59250 [Actinoplanes nipponensis]
MEIGGVVATDAGMAGLWSPASFAHVVDYDTGESALPADEDIARHIADGAFVPVNIGGDGAFQVVVRAGSSSTTAELSQRERRFLLTSSQPHLFVSAGVALISGIQHVQGAAGEGLRLPAAAGSLERHRRPDRLGRRTRPADQLRKSAPTALPDLVLLINPALAGPTRYRTSLQTFER